VNSEVTFSAIEMLDRIIRFALECRASDIHLEMQHDGMQVKFRVDGVLNAFERVPNTKWAEQLISRIKVLAHLDIAEKRIPQDGRLHVKSQAREVDIRVSIMPSIIGEDAVLRILDKTHLTEDFGALSLDSLGFSKTTVERLRALGRLPYGMLLVTGPTGSGKTTTLYGLISELADPKEKTVTIEDPVEYQIPGILQIPVNEKKGLTFAVGLRSILRHDPDRLLIGEIRDRETADIAVQSALTGHQVFSSVHANSALDVFSRFMHLGCDLQALTNGLNGIVAQRLVRKLCSVCSAKRMQCANCDGLGYRGRTAFAEVL
jgi:general secretion pathway protein E